MIDTHVHLDDTRYDVDRDALIARAKAAGVGTLITIGTNLEDSAWVRDYVAQRDGIYGAIGEHPEQVETWDDERLRAYRAIAKGAKNIVAIGEVGLDFHRPEFSLAKQEPAFRDFIRLALELNLPLVIHQREAATDTLRVLREEGAERVGGVFHCFAGDAAAAKGALDLNFDLAVGGILTYKSAQPLRDVIAGVPLSRLLLETDGPWLAPQDWRGQRNEPAYIIAVAAKLAELKGVSVAEVEKATTANAKRVFKLND